ncbi:hypothetical protein M1247_03850 [Mycobacterium sp. 21AC1]|uniref:hypothetical protein n=1 Tax=[Mycobacterium] appelbergii TaxID=2939269 RepID=UPI002938F320|nr:hypothetical protein [Mycobacterium sp. 21AC1]MDV3124035.1 hypothetical protein [Mycobacterium sp. 21AC1]
MDSLVTIAVPALVAVLTAAGAVIGVQFRDVDAYERRRGVWQWLLVLLATVATAGATNSASGVGQPLAAALMAVFAVAAAIVAHVMWRRLVPDAEPRTRAQATAAAAAAAVVVVAAVGFTYMSGTGCRQADPLVQSSRASSGLILPVFAAGQGPTVGDFDTWAKVIHEQAGQVTEGDVAQHAKRLGELSGQITDAVRANDRVQHALLGAQFYDELKPIMIKCYPQQ